MKEEIILESNIEELSRKVLCNEIYNRPGVWALYGKKNEEQWTCLEVAKTANIKTEINSAIYILITPENPKCKKCTETYRAKRKFENISAEFNVHKCKRCEHTDNLRLKSWKRNPRYIDKYKHMIEQGYKRLKFICVCMSEEMYNDKSRKEVERNYAKENTPLYWWDNQKL